MGALWPKAKEVGAQRFFTYVRDGELDIPFAWVFRIQQQKLVTEVHSLSSKGCGTPSS